VIFTLGIWDLIFELHRTNRAEIRRSETVFRIKVKQVPPALHSSLSLPSLEALSTAVAR
jgi:hypothetical protein